jgi:hypothetical protein
MVSTIDPYSINLSFLDQSCYFVIQVAPQLFFLENLVVPGIEPGTSGSVARNSGH